MGLGGYGKDFDSDYIFLVDIACSFKVMDPVHILVNSKLSVIGT
jgi:hypothetical protein